jgi:hypothetical protein
MGGKEIDSTHGGHRWEELLYRSGKKAVGIQ